MRTLWRKALDRVAPYDAGKSLEALSRELGIADLVRLSANESPLGPSPRAVEALKREAERVHLYPDGGSTALRAAIARLSGVDPDWILVGNGADEVLSIIARAVLDPGDEIVVPHPSFEPYSTEALLAGARIVASPLSGYDTDVGDMARRVTLQTKAVFVCTPHNPASTLVTRGALEGLLAALGDDGPMLVLDEAYRDFSDDPETADGAALVQRHPRVVALRTFSKIAGLAGLRVGYAIARPDAIDRLNRVRAPYNVNRLAQAGALAALEDRAHLDATRALVLAERQKLRAALERLGAPSPPSQANFLLVSAGERAAAFRSGLLREGIIVRDGAGVGFHGHLRIAIGRPEHNARVVEVWERVSRQAA